MQIFSMPLPMELKKTLRDVIDFEKKQDDKILLFFKRIASFIRN